MANFTNRTLTIFDVKDKLGAALSSHLQGFKRLDDASDRLNNKSNRLFSALDKRMTSFRAKGAAFADGLADFVPALGGIGPALISPMGAAAAGVGLLATGLVVATNRAKVFEDQFMELANLNLDKSRDEIDRLKKSVLDSAFVTGKSAEATSMAFFDVQSATGKYGQEVDAIVKKVADFSKATKTDFNTAIQGTVKGILNYGLSVNDLDQYLASSFKTVQTGIVTFDQLAKVQTDYAGAANTAGQSVDSANQLFTVFTAKTKSAEEAATLTKSALQDLLKPQTLKTFEKFGVSAFDKTTGKVKQLDQIVGELNETFKEFRNDDKKLTNLINQFKGSEGLTALIGETARNGENMIKTFNSFDNTSFEMDKALENAKNNSLIISDEIKNKWNTILIGIGEEVLPGVNSLLGFINDNMGGIRTTTKFLLDITKEWWSVLGQGIDLTKKSFDFFVKTPFDKVSGFFNPEKELLKQPREGDTMSRVEALAKMKGNDTALTPPKGTGTTSSTDQLRLLAEGEQKVRDGVRGVVTGGNQVRNVNVSIAKLMGIETLVTNNLQQDANSMRRLKEAITQVVVEAVRDSEIAIAN